MRARVPGRIPPSARDPAGSPGRAIPLALEDVGAATPIATRCESRESWLGVHLPSLALEALRPEAASGPSVIVESQARTRQVVALDERARGAGVRDGMTLAAALALAPDLEVRTRDPRRERELLERLATLAQRFTPRVSLAPPDGIVLEVRGSLHLFGGAPGLIGAFEAECALAGVRPALALAPTPLAALAGARAGRPFIVTDAARLVGALAPLPLAVLRWPDEVLARLARMGVVTIGQALRLPRAGFAQRFGAAQLEVLDRLTGRRPDPRGGFRARERFHGRRDFCHEIEHHAALVEALAPLVEDLGDFLEARQSGITELECRLRHRHAEPTRHVLRLAAPEADAQVLAALLGERLAMVALPEPVRACELRSGQLVPRASLSGMLWRPGEHGGCAGAETPQFIERLRARLGADAVYGVQLFEEHRPENAWRVAEPQAPRAAAAAGRADLRRCAWASGRPFRRPLWLLPAPRLLPVEAGLPRYRGPLRLLGEPERIESGWWDGADVARDYYAALDARGARLWVFRERIPPNRWFLHGIFG